MHIKPAQRTLYNPCSSWIVREMGLAVLRPSEIRYTQDSILNRFRSSDSERGKLLGEVLSDLCDGILRVSDIPPIKVFLYKGYYWSADNRRLWVFKELENLGKCDWLPVKCIDFKCVRKTKFTTKNNGQAIKVRDDPYGISFVLECARGTPVDRSFRDILTRNYCREGARLRRTDHGGFPMAQGAVQFQRNMYIKQVNRIIHHYIVVPEADYDEDDEYQESDDDDSGPQAGWQRIWSVTWSVAKWISTSAMWLLLLLLVISMLILLLITMVPIEKHRQ